MENNSELEGISFVDSTINGLMPSDTPYGSKENPLKSWKPFPGKKEDLELKK